MKLYSADRAPSPRRARIVMAEKGINLDEIEVINLDLGGGDNLKPEFRQKNPMTRVPVLELDDGTCLAEGAAIARYFEETIPEPPLLGRNALEKARVAMWSQRMEINLFLHVGMAFRNISGFFKDRETPVPEWGELCRQEVVSMIDFLDRHLGDNEYIVGDYYSFADITALIAIDFAAVIKARIEERHQNLARWHETVSSRPAASA